jgi:predicted anti-sigma-YlaC factor YlaD
LFVAALVASFVGCSFKGRAVNALVDVLGDAETVYLSDEDPELVAAALPFNLKTVETLLVSSPEHRELLLSAAKGFSLYAYGFVEPETRTIPYAEFERAEAVRVRAAAMYRRAYEYGLRGLEVSHPGLRDRLIVDPHVAAAELSDQELSLMVWTAAALGGAISASKDDPESTADTEVVGALLERALELDEDFDHGTIHEFLLAYEASRVGGSRDKAMQHYERALQLGVSKKPAIWLSWAETISVSEQNRDEFLDLVERALDFDVNEFPRNRLLNVLSQRRARWLRANVDEFFLTDHES